MARKQSARHSHGREKDSIAAFCGIARRDEIEQLYDAEMVCQRLNDHRRSQSNAHLQHFARLLD